MTEEQNAMGRPKCPRVDPGSEPKPWIEQPSTVKLLWRVSFAVLALLVALDLFAHHHRHFELGGVPIDGTFGFSAWYGFTTCILMVVFSKKIIGAVLKRKDTYYE